MGETLERLGIGLSLLLRYSYGGFLLIVLASVVNPNATGRILRVMNWEITALSALIIGAGIYATHRGVAIPAHHFLLCTFLWIRDRIRRVPAEKSNSPTRWLGSSAIGVKLGRRISAYTALRRGYFFPEKEKRSLDLAHAESGLIVMNFEGFFLAWCYTSAYRPQWAPNPHILAILALVFFIFSFVPGWTQHQIECRRFKNKEYAVVKILKDDGLLT